MKKRKKSHGWLLFKMILMVTLAITCSKQPGSNPKANDELKDFDLKEKRAKVNETVINQKKDVISNIKAGKNQYISEKYGFAFNYNQLMINDKPSGHDVIELKHLSGDRAVISIRKPEPIEGSPEDYIREAHKGLGQKLYTRKEFKLGKYPALLAEFSQEVMKIKMRVIELTAVKDGYFYSLVVTMDDRYVDDVRQEFDVVVNSFRLLDTQVSLEERWKDELPKDFPHEVLPLYAVEQIYYVSGKSLATSRRLTVIYDSKESRENLINYYESVMQEAERLPAQGSAIIRGIKSGYIIEIEIESFAYLKKSRVTIRIALK
ncbi:MAG: photosystem II reaction center PsbP family protein [Candidatus Aminicenantes bacterium]|nr:photosystem II reaction center PsbP family protein [Candidatus Aminicenantes bacterium]